MAKKLKMFKNSDFNNSPHRRSERRQVAGRLHVRPIQLVERHLAQTVHNALVMLLQIVGHRAIHLLR